MTDEELVETAAGYAAERGQSVENYDAAVTQREGSECWVVFHGRSGQPGDHFSVVVDVETGEPLRLVLGR